MNKENVRSTAVPVAIDTKTAARKKLEEMNLIDDFLIGAVMSREETAERFSRIL